MHNTVASFSLDTSEVTLDCSSFSVLKPWKLYRGNTWLSHWQLWSPCFSELTLNRLSLHHNYFSSGDSEGLNWMLWMPAKTNTENLPRLHHKKHSIRANSLHCVGKTSLQVSCLFVVEKYLILYDNFIRFCDKVALYILKAFEMVWHWCLIWKLTPFNSLP